EDVVGGADSRLDVLQTEWTVLFREGLNRRDEDVRPDLLVAKLVSEVLEAQSALQRQAVERPSILRVNREDLLLLILVRSLVGVHRQLVGNAAAEVVPQLLVVVEVLRERRVVLVITHTELRGVRSGHVRHGALCDRRKPGMPRPVRGSVVQAG